MIDTHAHIFVEYYQNIDIIVEKCQNMSINAIINCADDISTSKETLELSSKYPKFIFPAIGIHPQNVDNIDGNSLFEIEQMIKNNKIVAIGEIGLDYYYNNQNREKQKQLFIEQIDLAKKYDLPIIVHTRESIQDCYDILKNYQIKGVIHCFTGSVEMAKQFTKLGFYLGIGGVLTFKNSNLYKVIEKIDIKHLLLETDSPYLSPEPYRGTINDPSNVKYVAEKIATIKKISVDKVIEITTKNARNIFDLN